MPNVNWTWLLVGIVLGWLVLPGVVAAVTSRRAKA